MFTVNQKVRPVDKEAVLNDTLLHDSGRQIIKDAGCVGTVTQVKVEDDGRALNYVTYEGPGGILTQVYRDEEIEVAQ